jgi:hypothetical protein
MTPYYEKNKNKLLVQQKKYNKSEAGKATRRRARNKLRIKHKKIVTQYLECHPCIHCGENRIVCLAFHHRNPNEKKNSVSMMHNCTTKALLSEISKCDILCHNCHAIEHEKTRQS